MNVIYVFATSKEPKRPIIHVTIASPSPKKLKSIHGAPFENDSLDLFTRYTQSKAPYRKVAHTYNTHRNNKNDYDSNTSLPPSLPYLPQVPKPSVKQSSDYDLIEQLRVTPAKISLWDLLQTDLVYQGML